jgi:hypothetical protein
MPDTGIKLWTPTEIRENLESDDVWVTKGVVAIFNKQTEDEQDCEQTKHINGIGYNGIDSLIMSSFAKQINNFRPGKFKSPLSAKQMRIARKKILKYSGQLAKIANGEI